MSQINRNIKALDFFKSDGTKAAAALDPTNGWGVNIPSTGTWYVELGAPFSNLVTETQDQSLSLKWALALAGTLTVEVTNFPPWLGDSPGPSMLTAGAVDVSLIDATAAWQLFNPATASAQAYTAASGAGNSWTNLTLTLGGTAAGGAFANMPGTTMRRMRGKLVVATIGFIRALSWGKISN